MIKCRMETPNCSLSGARGQANGNDVSCFPIARRSFRTHSFAFSSPHARQPHLKDDSMSDSASKWRMTVYFFINLRLECYSWRRTHRKSLPLVVLSYDFVTRGADAESREPPTAL